MSVYFLRYGKLVKIGYSSNLAARVRGIIKASPADVKFIGYMPGGREVESHLHHVFHESRFSGEWFAESDDLLALIRICTVPTIDDVQEPRSGISKRLFDSEDEIADLSRRFRLAAQRLWPWQNNKERIGLIANELRWTTRRVRTIYNLEPNAVLRSVEKDEASEWLRTAVEMDSRIVGNTAHPDNDGNSD